VADEKGPWWYGGGAEEERPQAALGQKRKGLRPWAQARVRAWLSSYGEVTVVVA